MISLALVYPQKNIDMQVNECAASNFDDLRREEMKTIYAMIIFLLFSGCGDSTGPSQVLRDQLVVIDTATGSVIETVNLTIGGNCETEISSDGNFLYILRNCHISKFDLNGMTIEKELFLPVGGTPLISSAISENDSLLFVVAAGLSPMLYKVTTADMANCRHNGSWCLLTTCSRR